MKEKLLERLFELNNWVLGSDKFKYGDNLDELHGYITAVKDEIKFLKEILDLKD